MVQKQARDNYKFLDEKLVFANDKTCKEDYSSKRLPYSLVKADTPAYDRLMSTLYSPEERRKIEWAVGSVINGASKKIQKFIVFYGPAGSGKSTVINIIQQLFTCDRSDSHGYPLKYYSAFDAKALASQNNNFSMEYFKDNPLVAIQHDGDLSRIEDNTKLNSLISHEWITVNEKHKSLYSAQFKCFLFMGSNKPVKITDAKSGLIRRLIDVTPSGEKLKHKEYNECMNNIKFELGGIAQHCKEVFEEDPSYYDDYIPVNMLGATNDFYNFVSENYFKFKESKGITLKAAYESYKAYCDEAKVAYPFSQRIFKEELKNYFGDFSERGYLEDGTRVRSYYTNFLENKFEPDYDNTVPEAPASTIKFRKIHSLLDDLLKDCPAQYANDEGSPTYKWANVKTKLSDLDTSKLHFVKGPANHIFIDFDLSDENGNKSLERNIEAASKFPPTYAELSKSGTGVHLHYTYTGNVEELSSIYSENIEIKVFKGNSSLRRKLTLCNDLPIANLNSGLPKKEAKKVVNSTVMQSEKSIRNLIIRNLNKEIHNNTAQSVSFIKQILDDAYSSGVIYDVTDLYTPVLSFASKSTHQADKCMSLVLEMHFSSEKESDQGSYTSGDDCITFFDCEVYPNLFLINYKAEGKDRPIMRLTNPTPEQVEDLISKKLVGFNNRRYDNHILYARILGYSNQQLYELSQRIVGGDRSAFFREAYNLSYTDIFDFTSKKQGLKKYEIELGITHKEMSLPWDKPVPEELWQDVSAYCDNDVKATEAVFNARKQDFEARLGLAKIAKGIPNDSTNSLTTKLIFGNNRHPQSSFNYVDLSKEFPGYDCGFERDEDGVPHYPRLRKATYLGKETGEGGYVYSKPGMYFGKILVPDVASMHPHSIIAMNLFGNEYTLRFKDLVEVRLAFKHHDRDKIKTIAGGGFAEFVDLSDEGLNNIAAALKIAINSVYGLTSAKFDNAFRDPRNLDNIVAKRGALFMITLQSELEKAGVDVIHIKVDSLKLLNPDEDTVNFVSDFGRKYGYKFDFEAEYDRICLINDAAYIAKYSDNKEINGKHAGEWTATADPFIVPYIFKSLFSHEPIEFSDMTETFSVTTALYLDFQEGLPDVSKEEAALKKAVKNKADESYISELKEQIAKGHNYKFVGKVGNFCPMLPGAGGGRLLRHKDDKYDYASGAKGYLWMDSETVKELGLEDKIDKSYFRKQCDDVVEAMSAFGDFNEFVSA